MIWGVGVCLNAGLNWSNVARDSQTWHISSDSAGFQKNMENRKLETLENDEKSQFIPLWKIIRALQVALSGIILHWREFTRLFFIIHHIKTQYFFLFESERSFEPVNHARRKHPSVWISSYTWYKAYKGMKKIWIINCYFFTFWHDFKIWRFFSFGRLKI